ncbi:hypothetical protein AAF712_003518 [Marasmius tenuissimus]|uniref:EthD domain-containing protein n=1 Tax=Marasmius tenuissimus TaxID=585030 RepID=A0ABR3A904_9AGAR
MQTAPASSPPPSQPQLQVLIFVKHNLDITPPSEFSRRWRETHGPLVCSIGAIQRNIRRYEQLHVNHEIKPKLRTMGLAIPDTYDGVTLFEVDSIDKLCEVFDDAEYQEKVIPSELRLFDMGSIKNLNSTAPTFDANSGRLLLNLFKRDDLTFEHFDRYWLETHSKVVTDIPIAREKITLYEQLHLHPGPAPELPHPTMKGQDRSEADGVVLLQSTSLEEIFDLIYLNEEFRQVSGPDEVKFIKNIVQSPMILPLNVVSLI